MADVDKHHAREIAAIRRADGESRTLAASLPRLVLEARRIAANVIHGLHGRRRAGDEANAIDGERSGHSHTVWAASHSCSRT